MSVREIGLSLRPAPTDVDLASVVQAEREGFDVATYGDSPPAFGDPFVRIGAAAQVTNRIKLATCGINPVTRHASVVAGGAATIQAMTRGRAILGLARGDSSLKLIGREYPSPLAEFGRQAAAIRRYLHGDTVDLDGYDSRLNWLVGDLAPVPVDISCSGPRAIAQAARVADRVSFQVGTNPDRVRWAMAIAQRSLAEAGRAEVEVTFGAFVNVAVVDDLDRGLELMRRRALYGVHKSAMRDSPVAEHPDVLRRVSEPVRLVNVGASDADPLSFVDAAFVDWWAAVGDEAAVGAKLAALFDLGLSYVNVTIGDPAERDFTAEARARFVAGVMPSLRADGADAG